METKRANPPDGASVGTLVFDLTTTPPSTRWRSPHADNPPKERPTRVEVVNNEQSIVGEIFELWEATAIIGEVPLTLIGTHGDTPSLEINMQGPDPTPSAAVLMTPRHLRLHPTPGKPFSEQLEMPTSRTRLESFSKALQELRRSKTPIFIGSSATVLCNYLAERIRLLIPEKLPGERLYLLGIDD